MCLGQDGSRLQVKVRVGRSANDRLIILGRRWLVLFQEPLSSKAGLLGIHHRGLLLLLVDLRLSLLLVDLRLLWWLVGDKYAVRPRYHLHQLTVRTLRYNRLRLRHYNRLGSKQRLR